MTSSQRFGLIFKGYIFLMQRKRSDELVGTQTVSSEHAGPV